jgi:predicted phage-related endonuclease
MNELVKVENGNITIVPEELQRLKQYQEIKLKAEMLEKEIKQQLLIAMENNGIKKWSNDVFNAIYVAETQRTSIDTKRLKEELPDIAEEYSKTSNVKSSVRVSFND